MSERKLIEKGDIIILEKGMKVTAFIPEKFVYKSHPYSMRIVHATIEIGEIYFSSPLSKETAVEKMRKIFLTDFGVELPEEDVVSLVDSLNIDYEPKKLDTSIYEGDFLVEHAGYEGDYKRLRTSPFLVECSKVGDSSIRVQFYLNTPYIYPNVEKIEVLEHS